MFIFRFEKSKTKVIVSIKDQNSDSYGECFSITDDGLEYKGYFGFSADNFDDQHVNDIDLYSLNVYNTGGNTDYNRTIRGDKEINPSVRASEDIMHKYKGNQDTIMSQKVNLSNDKAKNSSLTTVNINKTDSNVDLMVKFRQLENVYRQHVYDFEKNVASLDANTAQIIEFNKQKAYNMSLTFQNIDKKTQSLYTERMIPMKEETPIKDERSDLLKNTIYDLDQKIGEVMLIII